jgi:hypothetical protein
MDNYFFFFQKKMLLILIENLENLGNSWNWYVSIKLNIAKPQTKSAIQNQKLDNTTIYLKPQCLRSVWYISLLYLYVHFSI